MQLEELKKNMSVLDLVLAKTSSDIKVNIAASETAQHKILKKYRQAFMSNLVLAVVFSCLWIGNVDPVKLLNMYKAYIAVMCAAASAWYLFLFMRLRKVEISLLTPKSLFSETTKIKILTLSGEVFFGLLLTVFFTLFLSEMFVTNQLVFVLIVGLLSVSLVWSVVYVWPRYIKLFRDLNSIQ